MIQEVVRRIDGAQDDPHFITVDEVNESGYFALQTNDGDVYFLVEISWNSYNWCTVEGVGHFGSSYECKKDALVYAVGNSRFLVIKAGSPKELLQWAVKQ